MLSLIKSVLKSIELFLSLKNKTFYLQLKQDHEEERKLPQFKGTKEEDIKAGCFEFEYYDIFGRISFLLFINDFKYFY